MKGGTCHQCCTCGALFSAYATAAAHANDTHGGARLELHHVAKGHLVLPSHDYGYGVTYHDIDMTGAELTVTAVWGSPRPYTVVVRRPGCDPSHTGSYKTERSALRYAERIQEAMK